MTRHAMATRIPDAADDLMPLSLALAFAVGAPRPD